MRSCIRNTRWLLLALLGVWTLHAQTGVVETITWADDPTYSSAVTWQVTANGTVLPCTNATKTGTTWSCQATLPAGTYPLQLRGTSRTTGPWSTAITATVKGTVPGTFTITRAFPLPKPHMGFTASKSYTTDASQAGTADSTNYPILFIRTDTYLKAVANGGQAQQSNGSDVLFFSDAAATAQVPSELIFYDGTAGTVWAWVRPFTTLSHTANQTFYAGVGNASPPARTSGVWDSNYKGVYHFGDGTTLALTDSSGNGNTATNSGATVTTAPPGGGAAFDGISQIINTPGLGLSATPLTFELWVNAAALTGVGFSFLRNDAGIFGDWEGWYSGGNNDNAVAVAGNFTTFGGSSGFTPSTGTWYSVMLVYANDSSRIAYLNGVADTPNTTTVTPTAAGGGATYHGTLGASGHGNITDNYWPGSLGEVRASNIARTASWATANYNSQKSGSTFLTDGSLVLLTDALEWRGFQPTLRGLHARAVNVGY